MSSSEVAEVQIAVEVLSRHGIVSPLEAVCDGGGVSLSTLACARAADRLAESGHVIEAERVRWADAGERYDLASELATEHLDVGDIRRI